MAAGRWERVTAALAPGQALVLVPGPAWRYVAGWSPLPDERPAFLWLSGEGRAAALPALAREAAEAAWPGMTVFSYADGASPAPAVQAAWEAVGRPQRVALDEGCGWLQLRLLEDALPGGFEAGPASAVLGPLRLVKDAAELAALQQAQTINDAAMAAAFAQLAPDRTERELAALIREAYRAGGADGEAFILVAAGAHSALPHHEPEDTPLGSGPVLLDIGCWKDGYASDMTRMAYLAPVGEVPADFRAVAEAVEAALVAGLARLRPGLLAGEADAAVRAVISGRGYGPYFTHRTGHGIGVQVHEPPSLAPGELLPLPAGTVFSVEPGIYLPGRFGVRLEEVVVLEDAGPRLLSRLSRSLHVVAV
ncbi:Peptidase M24 [Candidatus Hydrogenisulfobacillus filiaventi]|uniref:Peptidase M24 n=1 Tax=Candidatus Hydrogenisulfobacillus filiaventi TaxID=2707344 RepID=A0A6F8ZJQ3_9FIRM|nr:M24 family metallopeptidase [Bacillota bacterium]CAB1130219.1 Peptidase M24 [Candidatus Hydrogenisulfobacillus filiaventi]